jgi:hypothetical protein
MAKSEPSTEYELLTGKPAVDEDRLKQYADLRREINATEARLKYLKRIEKKHRELEDYMWVQANGEVRSIVELDDTHLINIVKALNRHSTRIPEKVEDEIYRRKLTDKVGTLLLEAPDPLDNDPDYIDW